MQYFKIHIKYGIEKHILNMFITLNPLILKVIHINK